MVWRIALFTLVSMMLSCANARKMKLQSTRRQKFGPFLELYNKPQEILRGGEKTQGEEGRAQTTENYNVLPKEKKVLPSLSWRVLAEIIGTCFLIHVGCGVVCTGLYCDTGHGIMFTALIWGVTVAICVYATRDISGAHLNPAITATLCVNDGFPLEEVLPYMGAQMLGAIIGATINYFIYSKAIASYESKESIVRGSHGSGASFKGAFGCIPTEEFVNVLGALICEIWSTALLVFGVFAITDPNRSVPPGGQPILVGGLIVALISCFGPLTCCGMNPVRDLGPRLITLCAGWRWSALSNGWWIYTAGPFAGAIAGGAAYKQSFF